MRVLYRDALVAEPAGQAKPGLSLRTTFGGALLRPLARKLEAVLESAFDDE